MQVCNGGFGGLHSGCLSNAKFVDAAQCVADAVGNQHGGRVESVCRPLTLGKFGGDDGFIGRKLDSCYAELPPAALGVVGLFPDGCFCIAIGHKRHDKAQHGESDLAE
jgi:hypothetical protein